MSEMSKLPTLIWFGLGAAVAMAVGAFGPWGKVVGIVNVSISGTDGSNDGWLVVGAAGVGVACLFAYAGVGKPAAIGVLLAGAAGAAVGIYDRSNVTDLNDESGTNLASIEVGWGLNLAIGASIALAVIGLIALLSDSDRAASAASETPQPETATAPRPPQARDSTTADELERLAELQARGILTDDEFQSAKQRLLEGS
jgi:hypothetical protein